MTRRNAASERVRVRDWRAPATGIRIAILSSGVHTDFEVPVQAAGIDWATRLPREWFEAVDSRFDWIAFGWGDRRF